jgi:LemA protein
MTAGELLPVGVVAVLALWMFGAYNRLVALRHAIHTAWGQIDEQLRRRGDALPRLVQALRAPLVAEARALDAVVEAQAHAQAAAERVARKPTAPDALPVYARGDAALSSAIERLLALVDQQPALREHDDIAALLRELHDADLRIAFARTAFNDAVDAYNAALAQFPTRLLGPLYGFAAATRW